MLGSLTLYLKGMRRMMFQLSGYYYSFNPRNLRTHILRLLVPKTILYKAFGLF